MAYSRASQSALRGLTARDRADIAALALAVHRHSFTAAPLCQLTGFDHAHLGRVAWAAGELGLVLHTGQIHPPLTLTDQGRAWLPAFISEGTAP